jgi:hypothetical protein
LASLALVAGKHGVVNEASWESLDREIEALRKENGCPEVKGSTRVSWT